MRQDDTRAMDVLRIAAFVVPVLMSLLFLAVGIINIDQPWGIALVVMGFFGLFAVGIGKWQESSAISTYGFFLNVSCGVIWIGGVIEAETLRILFFSVGAIGLMLAGIGATISLQLNRLLGDDGGMVDAQVIQLKHIQDLLQKLHENSLLSETTKRVLYHELELKLLRRRIDDLIARGNYDAGLDLCDAIEKAFENSEAADTFRHLLLRSRQEHHEAEIHGALEHFDRLLRMRDWAHAHQEAARIRRLYPQSELITELDTRIHTARDEHKEELLGQFNDAIQRDNTESAMKLLRELDRYLTREEATQLSSRAQSVVERHRDNLSTRFKMAVNDHRWSEAIQIGDLIRGEFPNSKMAEEVNSMIDVLHTRLTETTAAGPTAQE